ncbi:MAG TPA: rhomboid family intramembrane serine protease [Thermoanaerobaculia bacterium]|nr:rhomboid family intramembrane serine protease [Thermoanaerobaculia bacterium]
MIPIRHTHPRRNPPIVTRALVAANFAIFILQLYLATPTVERIIHTFGYIPSRLFNAEAWGYAPWEVAITLVSSLFLHGGFVHLFGNMIYLWVFGDAVEDTCGHSKYLVFFIACGVVGSLAHTYVFPRSVIPSIGASGSIAGILGAFFVLHPSARIVTLFPLVVYWAMAEIRAALFLPVWFFLQFFNGAASLAAARGTEEVAGVAWWAHVGGFVFSAGVAAILKAVSTFPRRQA